MIYYIIPHDIIFLIKWNSARVTNNFTACHLASFSCPVQGFHSLYLICTQEIINIQSYGNNIQLPFLTSERQKANHSATLSRENKQNNAINPSLSFSQSKPNLPPNLHTTSQPPYTPNIHNCRTSSSIPSVAPPPNFSPAPQCSTSPTNNMHTLTPITLSFFIILNTPQIKPLFHPPPPPSITPLSLKRQCPHSPPLLTKISLITQLRKSTLVDWLLKISKTHLRLSTLPSIRSDPGTNFLLMSRSLVPPPPPHMSQLMWPEMATPILPKINNLVSQQHPYKNHPPQIFPPYCLIFVSPNFDPFTNSYPYPNITFLPVKSQ
ncbi:hypothetical protein VP01_1829g5 [Puccinia sorghi]|uniref:Uncharacterized protein n=1 Tax=Puccinia sorghi TaxID=27349 RepID=A0A0L6VFR9_9BASI|nr:hypothetical protein VP01_1829g5 [Puccinia sorghi]